MTAGPIDSAEALRDRVRDAAHRRTALRVTGGCTWLDAGRPVPAKESVSTLGLSGIKEYVPGDLTLTAGAGTTLGEIHQATAAHNQWLALDPHGSDAGTLGATVATGSTGPVSTGFGTPRDLVLGIEFVTGIGAIARGGGRVVKNVAGFDLARLMTGAWGTLGVITEVTVRLHARPATDVTVAIEIGEMPGSEAGDVGKVQNLLRRLPSAPYACEVVNGELGGLLLGRAHAAVIVRVAGNTEAVAAQRAALNELGPAREVDDGIWKTLREAEPASAIVFRLSRPPAEIESTWTEGAAIVAACPGAMIHARPARGIVRVIVPRSESVVATLRDAFLRARGGKRIVERMPAELWAVASPPTTADDLSTRLKQAFDPHNVLNPGIFGERA